VTVDSVRLVGVTGGYGFLGWHTACRLHSLGFGVRRIGRPAASATSESSVDGLEAVIHIAGVNRGSDDEVRHGNLVAADQLISALSTATNGPSRVVYANSVQSANDSVYGNAKREAGERLQSYCVANGIDYVDVQIPNVFGEGGQPFYNSFVATFCHQIARGEQPQVLQDRTVPLVHAQEVANCLIEAMEGREATLTPTSIAVSEVLERLTSMHQVYTADARIPRLDTPFDVDLFNTLRSAVYAVSGPSLPFKKNVDNRGWLVETVKAETGGQVFVSTTKPGITRGQHYHLRKLERFVVVQGTAQICLRRLFSDDVQTFDVCGDSPVAVEIPTLHTHLITNTGSDLVLTLFWSNEIFDPSRPDTYGLSVQEGADR
jgi:UDP-2-acetamido-2,6-beta-L-arabino-hexul-4-ose reductase